MKKICQNKKRDTTAIPSGPKRRVTSRELFVRELLGAMVLTVVLMALSVFLPVFYQGDNSENTVTAPWLFIWVQELLRYFPPLSGGVIIPLGILGGMAALPWLPGTGSPHPVRRYYLGCHQGFILIIGLVLAVLTCLGL
ncbi:MAG: hypothetical protein JRG68_03365 [Deltaproteobacteria bacterium]|nr:hypothetical protein [Deltaproteobacteria bacterium]